MNTLILGSGFGLYGYLPSVAFYSKKIFLDKKYKNKFQERNILKKLEKKIYWYDTLKKITKEIDYLIIAKNPLSQFDSLKKVLKLKKKLNHVFLEKPIHINPKKSLNVIHFLKKNCIKFSVGFIFEYLNWFIYLKKKKNLEIIWSIKKKNILGSWKYDQKRGGGLIRFYGIHFLKLFSDLNYNKVEKNALLKNHWYLIVSDKKKNKISLNIKYENKDKFIIKNENKIYLSEINPFGKMIKKNKIDPRVSVLKRYIHTKIKKNQNNYSEYKTFVKFWQKIEKNINLKN